MNLTRSIGYGRWVGALLVVGACGPVLAQVTNDWPVPRHATFQLEPAASKLSLSLFTGGWTAHIQGKVKLFLGDPRVPVPVGPEAGWVGVSVDGADLVTLRNATDPATRPPLHLIQDPKVFSTGLWNTITYEIRFQLWLTVPNGQPPVPQPVSLHGALATYTNAAFTPVLSVEGDNGNIADAQMHLTIRALEVPPVPPLDIWFSTDIGFTSALLDPTGGTLTHVSDGDLLSRRGRIVRRNGELMAKLGVMPPVPDLGLDAAMLGPQGAIWFSFSQKNAPVWSETLRTWLKPGDLLSEKGQVVRTNEQLLANFMPQASDTSIARLDAGLDAVTQGPAMAVGGLSLLFSTDVPFYSRKLKTWVGHGDLLSDRGIIVKRNQDLLRNFAPLDPSASPLPRDYGLDAVVIRSNAEIWFSTKYGFQDAKLGPIGAGDLLSTAGYVVARNLDLVSAFGPIEDVNSFGLDAAILIVPMMPASVEMVDPETVATPTTQTPQNLTPTPTTW